MATHSSALAWKVPWAEEPGRLQSMGSLELDTTDFPFTFHFHAQEKELATHSSVLAGRIPGMGEPVGLPSMGSHRVEHDWSDLAAAAAATMVGSLTLLTIHLGKRNLRTFHFCSTLPPNCKFSAWPCYCSVAKSCLTLCNTMNCNTPGF